MTPRLAKAIADRQWRTGFVTYRATFWMLPNGRSEPTYRAVTTPPLRPVEVPPWLTVGASICIPTSAESVAAPYVIAEVSPLMCLIGPPGEDPFPVETEKLVRWWGPVPVAPGTL